MVELIQVQGRATGVHVGVNAVFQGFTLGLFFLVLSLNGGNPGGRCSHGVKIEHARIDELVQVYISVVALQHLGAGVDALHNALELAQLFRGNIGRLVQQHDVAEFNLLNDQALQVVFADVFLLQGSTAFELVLHAQGVHHRGNAVHVRKTVGYRLRSQGRHGADGLGNGSRLADTAGFNHNVIELAGGHQVGQLGHQVHLQGAADATVLQGHQAVVRGAHNATFLHQVCINVHLANVVHNNGELNALLVGQNAIQKRSLSASQIPGEQQHRRFFSIKSNVHIYKGRGLP